MKQLLLIIVCLLSSVVIYAQDSKIYSCAYDGYVNIRQQPSNKSAKLGQFRNGPQGAILLEDLGKWVKIKVGDVTGYVLKQFTQRTPTIAYTGNVSADWIEGVYYYNGYIYIIYNNGYWQCGYNFHFKRGYYIMQKNEVKLITEWQLIDGDYWADQWRKVDPNEEGAIMILQIDDQNGTLGGQTEDLIWVTEDECIDYPSYKNREELKTDGRALAEWMRQKRLGL
jgi:uncharacterized protein YgiM (DUF1202 family)